MGIEQAGLYLRYLREPPGRPELKVSRNDVIDRVRRAATGVKLNEKQLWEIEEKGRKAQPPVIFALIRALEANYDHYADLLLNEHATNADAMRLALEWLDRPTLDRLNALAEQTPGSDIGEVLQILTKLKDDPQKLAKWVGYGQGLID